MSHEANDKKPPFANTLTKAYQGPYAKWKQNMEVMKQNPYLESQFATGGCHNDLKIFDLNRPRKRIFAARNVSLFLMSFASCS